MQEADDEIGPVYRWKKDNDQKPDRLNLQTFYEPVRSYSTQWDQLTLINQVLHRIQERTDQVPTGGQLLYQSNYKVMQCS